MAPQRHVCQPSQQLVLRRPETRSDQSAVTFREGRDCACVVPETSLSNPGLVHGDTGFMAGNLTAEQPPTGDKPRVPMGCAEDVTSPCGVPALNARPQRGHEDTATPEWSGVPHTDRPPRGQSRGSHGDPRSRGARSRVCPGPASLSAKDVPGPLAGLEGDSVGKGCVQSCGRFLQFLSKFEILPK